MKSIAGRFAFVFCITFAAAASAQQYAIDPQTGQVYPVINTGGNGGASRASQSCEEAKMRLEENTRMAASTGRPMPADFVAMSRRRIARLCKQ